MSAELGSTTDPKALIPGDAGTVEHLAEQLQAYGDALHETGTSLKRIDTGDHWRGQAAERFQDKLQEQPTRWLRAGDAFHEAAAALRSHAAVLRWAQDQAREAIHLWPAGAVPDGADQGQPGAALAAAGPPVGHQREQAHAVLTRAREQLEIAGSHSARSLEQASAQAPQTPSFASSLGEKAHSLGGEILHLGGQALNGLASAGNAALHHPGDVAAGAAGMVLAAASLGGEGLGIGLDVTGAGAAVGVPVNAVSAAGVATGVGMAGAAAMNIAHHADGDDHVESADEQPQGSSASGSNPPGVKDGWQARPADNGKGTVYQDPNASGNADMVRVMDPTTRYTHGYVRFYNEQGQPVNLEGKPGPKSETHIPIRPDGSYPVPKGW